jgi:predicted DNA-binding antitoxin AbrB/MazE fold protein
MIRRIAATYKNGVFVPDEECNLPENARVQVKVESECLIPPKVLDERERKAILKRMAERRRRNQIPENAPRFTREELYERF